MKSATSISILPACFRIPMNSICFNQVPQNITTHNSYLVFGSGRSTRIILSIQVICSNFANLGAFNVEMND